MFKMPSEQELSERGGLPLPEDDYLAEVVEVTIDPDNVNPFPPYNTRDQLKVKFAIMSFADGSDLVDIDGNPVESFMLTSFIDPTRVGMKPQPSRARKFFAACMGVPLGSSIQIKGPEELIGKTLIVGTINKPGKEVGQLWTRAADYRPVKRVRPGKNAENAPLSINNVTAEPLEAEVTF